MLSIATIHTILRTASAAAALAAAISTPVVARADTGSPDAERLPGARSAPTAADSYRQAAAEVASTWQDGDITKRRAIFIVDDFEDGLDPGWTDRPGTSTYTIDTIGALGTSQSLKITGGSGLYGGLVYDLGFFEPTGISILVRSGSTTAADAYIVLGDDNVVVDNGAIFFWASNFGHFVVHTNGTTYSCGTYSANTWYQVDFVVDWDCKVFDVYVDNVLVQYNLPFRNPSIAHFSQLHVFNIDPSTAWWDEILMSTPAPSTLIFADDFERASTCHWSSVVP